MIRSTTKFEFRLPLLMIACFGFLCVGSCSKIYSEVQNEDLQIPISASKNIQDLFSYLEVVEFINSTHSSSGINRKNFDTLEQLINCKLEIIDSLVSDGDGYRYKVVFPSKTTNFQESMRNYDGKIRFGSFYVDLNFNYREINALSTITIDSSNACYLRNLNAEVTQIYGDFKFERVFTNKVNLQINNATLEREKIKNIISGIFDVSWFAGENTDGILNDQIVYSGSGNGVLNNTKYNWKTNLSLEKNFELGCGANIIKGILQVESIDNEKLYKIDFDPFNNKSCDAVVTINILGKQYEISL